MSPRLFVFAVCSVTLLACGGNVAVHETGGSGGAGTSTTGSTGGAGATGGGPSCAHSEDHFGLKVTGPGNQSLACDGAQPGTHVSKHVEGLVLASTTSTLTIDACPTCDALEQYQVEVDAPGFAINAAVGTPVQMDLSVDFPWGCSSTILVRNLASFQGTESPFGSTPILYSAGSEGSAGTIDGSPFTLATVALGCHPGAESCGGPGADEYRFDVGGTSLVQVQQGETKQVTVSYPGGTDTQVLSFRNLRSYETGWCDDYWNYAWWAIPGYLPD
jgi:hypothetical protein